MGDEESHASVETLNLTLPERWGTAGSRQWAGAGFCETVPWGCLLVPKSPSLFCVFRLDSNLRVGNYHVIPPGNKCRCHCLRVRSHTCPASLPRLLQAGGEKLSKPVILWVSASFQPNRVLVHVGSNLLSKFDLIFKTPNNPVSLVLLPWTGLGDLS